MKKIVLVTLVLSLIWGCKKDKDRHVVCNVKFTNSGNQKHSQKILDDADTLYTEFGDYIASVTPYKFTSKLMGIQFSDNKSIFDGGHKIELIWGETPSDDPQRYVDFSNNTSVDFEPNCSGGTTGHDGQFFSEEALEFIYFQFSFWYLYQEAILPAGYSGVNLSQFNGSIGNNTYVSDSVLHGNILKVDNFPLYDKLFENCGTGAPFSFTFGNTDSSWVVHLAAGVSMPEMEALANGPFVGPKTFVWSDKYEPFTLYKPDEGETVTIKCTVSFDTKNILQLYAGADNIPYTSDDVIVYAPRFWERVCVVVNIE